MSFQNRPVTLTYGSKQEVTITTSAGTSQLFASGLTGPVQARLVNHDTADRVAFRFGKKADTDVVALATSPTLPKGPVLEIITVFPNEDGSDVYWNVIGGASTGGGKFEVTKAQGI